ncbi:MAG: hypothetical protein EAX86_09585 [Candidatus Heimdallarchaeota archaeon]|nr:hypothetical protein [Candidatus Heimdallarchaeota archaeon]
MEIKNLKNKTNILSLILAFSLFYGSFVNETEVTGDIEPTEKIVLIDGANDQASGLYQEILALEISFSRLVINEKNDLPKIALKTGSIVILISHGTEEGLLVGKDIIYWKDDLALNLANFSPSCLFVVSCYSWYFEDYFPYEYSLYTVPYNMDAGIAASWTLINLLEEQYVNNNIDCFSNVQDLLKHQEYLMNKSNQRFKVISQDPRKFLPLSNELSTAYSHLDDVLGSDSNGYPIDYWVYDNTQYKGYNQYGTYVDDGVWENEGNNAINIIWYNFTSAEVYYGFGKFQWVDGWGLIPSPPFCSINYMRGSSSYIANNHDVAAMTLNYYWHCRLFDLSDENLNIIVGQCHKSIFTIEYPYHAWGYYEEVEDYLVDKWDGLTHNGCGYTAYAIETYPQTWRHRGDTNHPSPPDGDWDAYDFQDGICVFITKFDMSADNDVDDDGYSNLDELTSYKSDPWDAYDRFWDVKGVAPPIAFGTYIQDYIESGDVDWYKFSQASADEFTLYVMVETYATIVIRLYSGTGPSLTLRKTWTKAPGTGLIYSWDPQSTGWGNSYFVKITYSSGSWQGEYQTKVTYSAS